MTGSEAARPHFRIGPSPNPTWQPGQGSSSSSSSSSGAAQRPGTQAQSAKEQPAIPFTLIEPGKTAIDTKMLYRIMLGGIAPRPIALVGTYGDDGCANLATMSWYQMVSHDPPLVMVSFGGMRDGKLKDSERNIHQRNAFTISCATEALAEAVNHAAIDAPTGTSEFTLTGLTPIRGSRVEAPRVGESPFSMELTCDHVHRWNNDQGHHTTTMVIGRVRMLHVRNDIRDADGYIDIAALQPIARFAGETYGRMTEGYNLPIPRWSHFSQGSAYMALAQQTSRQDETRPDDHAIATRYP